MPRRKSKAVFHSPAHKRNSSKDIKPPLMSDLRIVLLGKNASENSRVGNFLLGRAAFETEEPPDVVQRVGGKHMTVINTPNISLHQMTQRVRECVSLSAPGPHVILLVLKHDQCSREEKECVEMLLNSFSHTVYQHTMMITTHESHTQVNDIIQEIIHKCNDRHFRLERNSTPAQLMEKCEEIVHSNGEHHLICTECESVKLNVVVCGSDRRLKASISNLILNESDRRSESSSECVRIEGEVSGRLISLVELPALSQLSEEEVMRQSLHCVSLCHPGVHVFILIIPDAPITDEDKAEMEKIQRIFSSRINKHIMVLIMQNSEHTTAELNEETKSVIESYAGRHHFCGPDTQVSVLMEKLEQMVKANNGDCFSTETFWDGQTNKLLKFEEMGRKIHSLESQFQSQDSSESRDDVRIVLLGKSGVGKSATGNTILGRKKFKANLSQESITKECQRETAEINGRHITVIDTPGLFDTELSHEDIQREITNCISMILPGPHVFIIVLNLGQRFTQEDTESVKIIQETFGENSLMYTMILFTRGDDLKNKTIEQWLGKPGSVIRNLIEECGNRIHVFNNNETRDRTQVSDLLEKIDVMVTANGDSYYSCKMFRQMERERQEKQMNIMMERVETLNREREELLTKHEEEKERMKKMMEEERQNQDKEKRREEEFNEREERYKREIKEKEEQEKKKRDEMKHERETLKHEMEEMRKEKAKIKTEKENLLMKYDTLMNRMKTREEQHKKQIKEKDTFLKKIQDEMKREQEEWEKQKQEEKLRREEEEKEKKKSKAEQEKGLRLAHAIKHTLSSKVEDGNSGRLPIFKLHTDETWQNRDGSCRRNTFGKNTSKENKTIMMIGATGAGKTTLINSMINYIMGVEWEDDFRFVLIDEGKQKSQAESQTSAITAYQINHMDGFRVQYSLTIVDTPGFGDTRGISHDQKITSLIHEFFSQRGGIDHIDAVCFVVQASLARLTHTQQYIFDSILSIFGKDIADNILVLATFADGDRPPVLEAMKVSEVPCATNESGDPLHFKLNNAAMFVSSNKPVKSDDGKFHEMFWKMGFTSLRKFFTSLNRMKTKSLSLTQEVLKERKQLEVLVEGLQPQINAGLSKLDEIKKTRAALEQHKSEMKANKNFEYEVEVTVPKQIKNTTGSFLTNCQTCHYTCHGNCAYANDADKDKCYVMTDGKCTVCPGKCVWNVHFNQKYKWDYVKEKRKDTYQDLKKRYEDAHGEVMSTEKIFKQLENEFAVVQDNVVLLIEKSKRSLERLQEISLKPNPLSTPDYIDLMIESEKQQAKPGFQDRIQSLMEVRKKAEIISKVSTGDVLSDEWKKYTFQTQTI